MTSPAITNATDTRINNQNVRMGSRLWVIFLAVTAILWRIVILPTEMDYYRQLAGLTDWGRGAIATYVWGLTVANLTVSILFVGIGLLIFWRKSDDRIGILSSSYLIAFGIAGTGFLYTTLDPTGVAGSVPLYYTYYLLSLVAWVSIFLFLGVFPDGRFVPDWLWLVFIGCGFTLFIWSLPTTSPFYAQNLPYGLGNIISIGVMASLVAAQVQRYRHHSNATQRQQTKIILFGSFILIVPAFMPAIILSNSFPQFYALDATGRPIYEIIQDFAFISMPISLGIAMLRYRLWDVDVVINRSLVYGILTAGAIAIFFGIASVLQVVIGEQQPLIALVISAVIAGLAFKPVRSLVEDFVDKRIYGFRFDLNELNAAQREIAITNPGILTGQILDGYEVQGVIGKGGMGEVYRGFGNGQIVAIKTMLPKVAQNEEMRKRFKREAETGKLLKHPNIASVIANGEYDGMPYLIMEYVEGQDLSDYIDAHQELDEETTTSIMQDVCAALTLAHEQGFVHRDLKPSNVMIRPDGQAVLMDFGITKLTDASTGLTGTGTIGTIDYMAPEQIIAAKDVDHRADIYALGVMLYEMMAGEKPFKGNAAQLLFAHLQQPPPNLLDVKPDTPVQMANATERAMSKDPDDRYQSAGDFVAALQ